MTKREVASKQRDVSLRQIIALGGGGFTDGNGVTPIDRYILKQSRSRNPSICFLATATGDRADFVQRFYDAFGKVRCQPSHIPLFARTPDLKTELLKQDIIYVGGGNTRSMLAVWHDWGIPAILRTAWRNGTVLCGRSAGAICWFMHGLTDSSADALRPMECLGILRGSCTPHYDGDAERRPAMHQYVASGQLQGGIALDDGAAAHYIGKKLHAVISERPGVAGYRVRHVKGRAVEEMLPTRNLR